MALKNRTKHLLAETLAEMLKTEALENVRVARLCELAEVQPRVFYYHFHDKYELAAWIYITDRDSIYGEFRERDRWDIDRSIGFMQQQMVLMWEKRELYLKLFADDSMYSLRKYVVSYNERMMAESTMIGRGMKSLDAEALCVVKFATFGWFENLIDWLKGNIKLTPEEFGRIQFELVSQTLISIHRRNYILEGMH